MAVVCKCTATPLVVITFTVTWWRHQMETFSALLALFAGNSPVTGDPPPPPHTHTHTHKGQWCGALMFSLICAWTNGWYRYDGDFRRHRAHYDATVIKNKEICRHSDGPIQVPSMYSAGTCIIQHLLFLTSAILFNTYSLVHILSYSQVKDMICNNGCLLSY